MFCEDYDSFEKTLTRLGYTVHSAQTKEEATSIVCQLIGTESVGCGGSVTTQELGLPEALSAQGATVFFHWLVPAEERAAVLSKAAQADWYLSSTNAITLDGQLINIDGSGNRVCGMIYGPKKVVVVAGKNKLAEDLHAGYNRVKSIAAPLNAKRLSCKTPCAVTGKCANCSSPGRICCVTTIIDKPTLSQKEFHLVLVDQELGY